MSVTLFSGPIATIGNQMDALLGAPQNTDPVAGPNLFYHSDGFLDVRYYPVPKDALDYSGTVSSSFISPTLVAVNAVPVTAGSGGNIAAPANVANGTAMTLATSPVAGISPGVPFLQFGTNTVLTGIGLDFGIEAVTTSTSSATITVSDSSVYRTGQPIVISNAGNSGKTAALLTYVTAIPSTTTITIADTPLAANTSVARIGSGLPGWQNSQGGLNGAAVRPIFAAPYIAGGVGSFFDPTQALQRAVSITGVSGGAGGAFTVRGADFYGQLQSEVITVAAGANTVKGVKTYKYILSVTPGFADAHNYSVNTIDIFGFPYRNDFWETLLIWDAGAIITSSTGWTKADKTSPATTATGDPRGTYALQTPSNSSNRLVIYQTLPFQNIVRATPSAPQFLYGVTPA